LQRGRWEAVLVIDRLIRDVCPAATTAVARIATAAAAERQRADQAKNGFHGRALPLRAKNPRGTGLRRQTTLPLASLRQIFARQSSGREARTCSFEVRLRLQFHLGKMGSRYSGIAAASDADQRRPAVGVELANGAWDRRRDSAVAFPGLVDLPNDPDGEKYAKEDPGCGLTAKKIFEQTDSGNVWSHSAFRSAVSTRVLHEFL
jgi:hypothetical protein